MESINKEKKTGEIEAITCVSKSASVPHNHLPATFNRKHIKPFFLP